VRSRQLGAEEAGAGAAHRHRGMRGAHAQGGAGAAGRRDGQGHADRAHAQGPAAQAPAAGSRPNLSRPQADTMPTATAALLVALALAGSLASAQTVYRCGNSYGTQPCAGGTALDVTDRSTPADADRARRLVAEDMKRADAMEKARLAQEKNAPKA